MNTWREIFSWRADPNSDICVGDIWYPEGHTSDNNKILYVGPYDLENELITSSVKFPTADRELVAGTPCVVLSDIGHVGNPHVPGVCTIKNLRRVWLLKKRKAEASQKLSWKNQPKPEVGVCYFFNGFPVEVKYVGAAYQNSLPISQFKGQKDVQPAPNDQIVCFTYPYDTKVCATDLRIFTNNLMKRKASQKLSWKNNSIYQGINVGDYWQYATSYPPREVLYVGPYDENNHLCTDALLFPDGLPLKEGTPCVVLWFEDYSRPKICTVDLLRAHWQPVKKGL